RFVLVRLADERWKFLWSVPALLLDGWSWPLVFGDVSRLYEGFAQQQPVQLESVRPYRSYLEWLGRQSADETGEFWRKNLAGFLKPTGLWTGAAGEVAGERYKRYSVPVSVETTSELQAAARGLHLTLNPLIQGAWSMLLSRRSGSADVVFGAAFAGRPTDLS